MGITTTAAILGGATLLGGIGGSMIGAKATKSAAKDASAAQLQMSRENNALAREFRDENTANFQPWMQSGGRANALVDSFLYGQAPTGTPTPEQYYAQSAPASHGRVSEFRPTYGDDARHAPVGAQPDPSGRVSEFRPHYGDDARGLPTAAELGQPPELGRAEEMPLPHALQGQRVAPVANALNPLAGVVGQGGSIHSPAFRAYLMGGEAPMLQPGGPGGLNDTAGSFQGSGFQTPTVQGAEPAGTVPAAGGSAPEGGGMSGYEAFVNSPYYQHPLQEGYRALNHGYAAGGMIESGAAMKGITKFGQDYGAGRMNEFIGLAERQSDRGLQSAGGIAGVGMNALSSMSNNNQNAANAMSNAAIARGNATAGMWSGIGSTIGTVAGMHAPNPYGFGGSSYGPINVTGYGGR